MNCAFCGFPVLPDQMVEIDREVFHWECVLQASRTRSGGGAEPSEPDRHPRIITRQSTWTGKIHEMVIWMTDAQFEEIENPDRRAVQKILPHASTEEREFLISGMSPQEQHQVFGEFDD